MEGHARQSAMNGSGFPSSGDILFFHMLTLNKVSPPPHPKPPLTYTMHPKGALSKNKDSYLALHCLFMCNSLFSINENQYDLEYFFLSFDMASEPQKVRVMSNRILNIKNSFNGFY